MSLEVIERAIEAHGTELKSFAEKSAAESKEVLERLDKIEAKGNRKQALETGGYSPGAVVLKSEGFRLLSGGQKSTGRVEVKNTIVGIANGSPQENFPVRADRAPGIYGYGFVPLGLTDILPVVRVTSNTYEYTRLRNFSEGAAIQAGEGVKKAESSMTFDLERANIVTIAHYIKVSTQVLADAAELKRNIDTMMTVNLAQKLENELLNATDDGVEIDGFLDVVDAYTGTSGRMVDNISGALATIRNRGFRPNAIVMNPVRWSFFETLIDSEGRYLSGSFTTPAAPVLWNTPVVLTSKIAANTILVGDFAMGAQLLMREDAHVQVGYENDDFTRNLVTILAEIRAGLAITVPAAFLKIVAGSPDL